MTCLHHWKIATQGGPTSTGVCTRCGAEREFQNVSDADIWGGEEGRRHRIQARNAQAIEPTPVNRVVW